MIRKMIIVILSLASVGTVGLFLFSLKWEIAWRSRGKCLDVAIIPGSTFTAYRRPGGLPHLDRIEPGWALRRATTIFHYWPQVTRRPAHWSFKIPLWMPFFVFATYPTIAFIRGPWRRYRRRRKGLCVKCGYDLRGNVSGVCSECGRPIGLP